MSNASQASGGTGIATVVQVIFLVLKLTETGAVAHWSWWWVMSPMWIPAAIIIAILAVAVPIAAIASSMQRKRDMASVMEDDTP